MTKIKHSLQYEEIYDIRPSDTLNCFYGEANLRNVSTYDFYGTVFNSGEIIEVKDQQGIVLSGSIHSIEFQELNDTKEIAAIKLYVENVKIKALNRYFSKNTAECLIIDIWSLYTVNFPTLPYWIDNLVIREEIKGRGHLLHSYSFEDQQYLKRIEMAKKNAIEKFK